MDKSDILQDISIDFSQLVKKHIKNIKKLDPQAQREFGRLLGDFKEGLDNLSEGTYESVNESAEKLFGKDFNIIRLQGNDYVLEYRKFSQEYTIKSLIDIEKKLNVALKKLPNELKPVSKRADVYVRFGDVAIGILLKSKLSHDDLEELLGFYIDERE